jgi:hypothetical protein
MGLDENAIIFSSPNTQKLGMQSKRLQPFEEIFTEKLLRDRHVFSLASTLSLDGR